MTFVYSSQFLLICPGLRHIGFLRASVSLVCFDRLLALTCSYLLLTVEQHMRQNLFAAEVGGSTYGGRSCAFVTCGKERA